MSTYDIPGITLDERSAAAKRLEARMAALDMQRIEPGFKERPPKCSICSDDGHMPIEDEAGVTRYTTCSCQLEAVRSRRAAKVARGIPENFRYFSWDTLPPYPEGLVAEAAAWADQCVAGLEARFQRDELEAGARRYAGVSPEDLPPRLREYMESPPPAPKPIPSLWLSGPTAAGKSALAAAVAHDVGHRLKDLPSNWLAWWTFDDFLRRVKATFGGDTIDRRTGERIDSLDLYESARAVPLFVLDDLAATRVTEFTPGELYALVNGRYEEQLPVILTVDAERTDLDAVYGERTIRRIYERSHVIHFDAREGARHPVREWPPKITAYGQAPKAA